MDMGTYINIAIEMSYETLDFNVVMFGDEEIADYGTVKRIE